MSTETYREPAETMSRSWNRSLYFVTATRSSAVSGWMCSKTARWPAPKAPASIRTPPIWSWMWRGSTAGTPVRTVTCAVPCKRGPPAIPSTPSIPSAAGSSLEGSCHLNVNASRGFRTIGQIFPALPIPHDTKRSGTALRSRA